MRYKNPNPGFLSPEDVQNGSTMKILEEAYSTKSKTNGQTYWNVKVELPDGSHRLASIFGSSGDDMKSAWGEDTNSWIDKSVTVRIEQGEKGPYILLEPVKGAGDQIQLPDIPPAGPEVDVPF